MSCLAPFILRAGHVCSAMSRPQEGAKTLGDISEKIAERVGPCITTGIHCGDDIDRSVRVNKFGA